MQQKIVVKMAVNNEKKSRKALKIAVGVPGVESMSFVGSNKDQIALTGEGIDSVALATLLRKSLGYTELVSVEEKKPAAPASAVASQTQPPMCVPYHVYEGRYNDDPSACSIM
ncbi:heavy metal-associated isoprenylated plant protein 16-like [Bidens hawaiensis]|uniref:heavy metal-associated isoprenylated plant protein 16-like n=1 Tax=Bidens hawaiensis TaxID=980011 RepID=UPI00404A9770